MKKKEEKSTLQNIVDAYITLCASTGNENITLKSLSKVTGISVSNIKYHLDQAEQSVEELSAKQIRDSINIYLDDNLFKERLVAGFDPLKTYSKNMLLWTLDYPDFAICLLLGYYKSALNKKSKAQSNFTHGLTKALSRIEALLNEGIGMGNYKSQIENKKNFIIEFHSIMLGNLIIATNLRVKEDVELRISLTHAYIEKQLYP